MYFYVRWLRPGPVLLCACRDTELAYSESFLLRTILLGPLVRQRFEHTTLWFVDINVQHWTAEAD